MIVSKQEIYSVLRQYNPWWLGNGIADLPNWKRAAFLQIKDWMKSPPAGRALLLSGARQVGKTTLFLQAVEYLLKKETPPSNILYVTFDHPLLKLVGLDKLIETWKEYESTVEGTEYLFLDEIQGIKDWQTWIKHQVDFEKNKQIAITGSATPLANESVESGVGRWQTIKIATLSFYEYLQIRNTPLPNLPSMPSLRCLFDWKEGDFIAVGQDAKPITSLFHEYLLRGGFPQSAKVDSITLAQKLLREDIVDKVLKRDMTALFGVRRVLELEQVFLYLCLHDGGLLDIKEICSGLEVKKPTANNFISLLEATHLIYRLMPHGYGKQILRAKPKVYLADAALAGSVLLKGKSLLEDADRTARAVETAFFKHVFTRYYDTAMRFSFWRGKGGLEVDIIAERGTTLTPFEVKYRNRDHTDLRTLGGIKAFCLEKNIEHGYVITRDTEDFGVIEVPNSSLKLAKITAPLACYWLGQSEVDASREGD